MNYRTYEEKILVDRHSGIISGKEARRRVRKLHSIEKNVEEGRMTPKTARKLLRDKSLWKRILGKS